MHYKFNDANRVYGFDHRLSEMELIAELKFFEIPLQLLYRDHSMNYIFHWCDCSEDESGEEVDRWLVIDADDSTIRQYLMGNLCLRSLILNNTFIYCVDLIQEETFVDSWGISPKSLPKEYLPKEGSLYKEKPTFIDNDTYKVDIDGDWDSIDFNLFARKFNQL